MTNREPTLATVTYTEDGKKYRMKIEGGLHYIRGNSAPYFTLTHSTDRWAGNRWAGNRWAGNRWVDDSGGAGHDIILKHRPEFADLAALHLSDIDGIPTHPVENAWY